MAKPTIAGSTTKEGNQVTDTKADGSRTNGDSGSRAGLDHAEYDRFVKERLEAGQKIDPDTAEVYWEYVQMADPYGVLDLPPEHIGRGYFARAPGSDLWIEFGDLPEATREA